MAGRGGFRGLPGRVGVLEQAERVATVSRAMIPDAASIGILSPKNLRNTRLGTWLRKQTSLVNRYITESSCGIGAYQIAVPKHSRLAGQVSKG